MSISFETSPHEVLVITRATRGTGFMTLVPARERGGKLVLSARDRHALQYVERVVATPPSH